MLRLRNFRHLGLSKDDRFLIRTALADSPRREIFRSPGYLQAPDVETGKRARSFHLRRNTVSDHTIAATWVDRFQELTPF